MFRKLLFILLISGLALTACSGSATPTPGDAPPVVVDDLAVFADGRLLPRQSVNLSFSVGGKVQELLIKEGEVVAADQVLARLENSAALAAQVSQAELEVLNAQQVLDDLQSSAEIVKANALLAVAQAQDALTKAEKELRNAKNPAGEGLQDTVADAKLALENAQAGLQLSNVSPEISAHQDAVFLTNWYRERYDELKAKLDKEPGNLDLKDKVEQAYNDYQSRLNDQLALELRIQTDQANKEDAVAKAQERYDEAQADLNKALKGPDTVKLALAQAKATMAQAALNDAQAEYAKVQNGPDPEKLALAEARLSTAQASLTAAQSALENAELRAPLAGTVADVKKLKVGEQVAPGQPVVTLADFSGWKVETDNLTEIDVVKIKEGQGATAVLDALPDVQLRGTVESISGVFEEKLGDVTYTVVIALADQHELMRWGMTAVVTFDK